MAIWRNLSRIILGLLSILVVRSELTCNFEEDTCDWKLSSKWIRSQEKSSNLTTGPADDHINPDGFYLHLNMSDIEPGEKAFVLSPPILNATKKYCLSFLYLLHGNQVGTLSVHVRNVSTSTEVWAATAEHGREWLYQEVPIEYGRQVMFESVFDEQSGNIAIDDIALNEGKCFETANEPGPRSSLPVKCTFEKSSTCGYRNRNSRMKWRLGSGSTSTRGTGPDNDHTLRTKKGHYMYIEASSSRHSGMKALLISPKYNTRGVTCIQFWYNMYGSHINTLNVYDGKRLIWSRKGSQGYGWTSAFIQRNVPRFLKVRFEGVTGRGSRGDIAIDDISIQHGRCPPPVDCTFENTLCGWSDSGDDDFDWSPRTGKRPKLALGPIKDHTLKSEKGTYMIIESKSPRRKSDRARLVSTTISESVKPQCLQFWYNMNGKDVGELRVFIHTQTRKTLQWRLSGPQGDKWAYASLPIQPDKENFWFVIEGMVKRQSQSYIAFDDISLTKGKCKVTPTKAAIGGKPMTTMPSVKVTTPVTTLNPSKMILHCEFTKDLCGWYQMKHSKVNWRMAKPGTHPHRTSPKTDHSTGKGSYIYVQAPNKIVGAARLFSPTTTPKKENMCLQFWYFMYGKDVDTLRVFISPGTDFDRNRNAHWKQSGSHPNKWNLGKVNFQMKQKFQIVFEAKVNGKPHETIALDDILLTYGSCNAGDDITTPKPGITEKPISIGDRNCDFESNNICGYKRVTGSPNYFWRRNSGETATSNTGPATDHTTNTAEGHYMYIEGSKQKKGTVARMITPLYKDSTSVCLQFYYHMYGSGIGNFTIYTVSRSSPAVLYFTDGQFNERNIAHDAGRSKDNQQIYFTSGNHGIYWEVNRVTIDKLTTAAGYKIMFEATVGKDNRADIALDDVSFTAGECSFIGDCDFEDDSCTWQNVNSDDFDWELHSGKTSTPQTGPEFDHTRGNKNGHYMYIETSAPTKPGMKAKLVSTVLPKLVRNACLQFWYNMYGNAVDSLKVTMQVTGYSKTVLWHLQGDQGKGWHFARVPLRGTATTYTITFEASSGDKYTGDIAIDDISFTENKCQISPSNAHVTTTVAPQITTEIMTTPAPLTGNFTCNFDTDLCGWIQDNQDNTDWFRKSGPTTTRDTGPPGDHTTGKGHYIYLETTRQSKGSVANLISPVYQPDKTRVNCVSFWYYMYGSHVNKLNVYIQYGLTLPNAPTWSEEGNKGQRWILGKFSFTSDALFNVVLSAVVGEAYDGDIAVDDVSIINGDCVDYITNAYLTCDFENKNICGFIQGTADTYDWTWHHGGTPSASTGPNTDHTFGTPSGHYMYIKGANPHGFSRLISPEIHTTYTSCVQFYYHMKGKVGDLYVYITTSSTVDRIWHRSGHQSKAWQLVSVEVSSNFTSFNIMFEAIIGGPASGDIAIDDFSVLKGKCSNEGLCNFEKDMCIWQNTNDDDFDWIIKEADKNSDSSAPRLDHTNAEIGSGHYLYVTTDHNPPTTKAVIETTDFEARSKSCLHFWFNSNGQDPGTLTVGIKSRGYHRVIWQLVGNKAGQWPTTGKWLDARVQLPRTSRTFTVTIEVVVGKSGYVAVDDILFDNEKDCSRLPSVSLPVITKPPTTTLQTTPVPIKTTPTKPAPSFSCDFTDDFCGWIQDKTDDIDWKRTNRSTATPNTGPSADHTTGSSYYIYIESSSPTKVGDVARLVSPRLTFTQTKCLTFWYSMHGETIGTLSVLLWINGHLSAPIWKRQRSQGSNWLKATVNIPGPQALQVIFEANSGNGFYGDIALDDIKLNDNACHSSEVSPLPSCDFESTCNYKSLEKSPSISWIITSSANHPNISDHTYNTTSGEFMYVNTSGARGQFSRIETPALQKGRYCLEFFYRAIGNFKGYFTVLTSRNRWKKDVFFKYGTSVKNEWTIAEMQLSIFSQSTVIFQTNSQGMLAVDDIFFKKGNCPRPGTCDFERGHLCFWTNDPSNKIDWVVHNGKTSTLSTGPTGDHTKRTASGIYALLESSYPAKVGDSVKLISQPLNNHNVMSCFEFWYFMSGKQVASLIISIRYANNKEITYWRLSSHQGNVWHDAQVPLPPSKTDFQIVIEGTVGGKNGDIAIDDLYVVENGCGISPKKAAVNIPSTTPPVIITTTIPPIITGAKTFNCTFENGTCGWVQSTTDNFNWTRHRGYTPSKETGPQGDHTTGRGYYMYMETSIKKGLKKAALMYVATNEIPGTKCMQFWYSMRGSSVGSLNIYIITQIGDGTPVWTKSGTQGPAWNLAKVEFNATAAFKVLIEGVKGDGFLGDIAVDDVSLQNEGCKEPYGDCDFEETDMCGYKNDPTGDFHWITKSGQTDTRFTGPKSDHTYGTSKGHYVYIEASRPRKLNDTARMLSPIYKAVPDEQCLQFYYNMYGKDVGALNVRIRVHDLDNTTYETDNYLQIVGEQGTDWLLAEVELPKLVVENPHQLIFEGVTGSGERGDIAIDDIIINYGECEVGGDCDFDYGRCTWMNVNMGDDFDWMVGSGKTSSVETGPLTDHTKQTSQGFYLYIESSFPRKPGQKAWYVSQEFPPVVGESRCLTFWYSMNGAGVGTLRVYIAFRYSGNNTLWELHQDQGNGWLFAQAPIKSPTKYKIIFEAVRGTDHRGDIAIDDILFTEFSCSLKPDLALPRIGKQTLPSITGTTPSSHVTGKGLNCTFDTGMCGWEQDTTDNFDWRENNGPTFVSGTGPNSDHNSNGTGFYLYIPSGGHHYGDKARLISPLMQPNGLQCLTVWYHMYGSDISTFNIYIFTGPAFPDPIFHRFGSKTNNWHRADIQFNSKSPYNVILEAFSSSRPKSEIAVDDVSIVTGHCRSVAVNDKMFCNFEDRNICNFTLESDNRSKWELNRGKLHIPDHTYRTLAGHFMFFLRIPGLTPGQYASLSSPIYNVDTTDICVNFWYYMSPLHTGMLTVSYLKNTDNFKSAETVFTRQGVQDSRWLQALIDIDVSGIKQFQVKFFGFAGKRIYEVIGLDDVTISSRSCRRQKGACDFEKGLCNWVNRQDDDFDWTIGSGLTTTTKSGPIKDFTPGTQSGSYLYIQPESDFLYDDKDSAIKFTILESETFDQKQRRCFQFHYYMKGAKDSDLEVLLHSEGSKTMKPIWRLEGHQGDEWKMAQILLPVKSEDYQTYQVILKGSRGTRFEGQVAIDELQFTDAFPCRIRPREAAITSIATTPLPTSQIPIVGFDCAFDKDICGWKQNVHSKFQWSRQKGLKNGPSSDHTGGGFFLYIDSTNMAPHAVAAMMSPNLTLTTQRCLSFYYYMAGEDLNTLSVVFRSDDGNETLWKREGPQGNQWNYATINLPIDDDGLNGIIQLTGIGPNVAASGFMALDDITLQYGECKSSPKNSIIDCDFESSNMCGYTNGKDDTSDWIRTSGEERSDNDDPDSDHTYGTSHGHYMYFEKPSKTRVYSALLWTPKFTAKMDACLTFWYRMSGKNVGSLKISFAPNTRRGNRMGVVWSRRGDQGPSWNKEYVNIGQDKDLYALFEATTPGKIAIDDVKLMHSCAEPGDCSFEKDTCGWHNANTNDLDWQRLDIRHITYYRHLPDHDHTNPDEFGHYMFFTSRNYVNPGKKADLLSVSFDPTSEKGLCFEFWFIIYGINYGNLTVFKQSKSSKNTIVWHLTKSKGHLWSRASFHVKSFEPYQITFRAVKGKGSAGYIAIDDINYSTILCAVTPPDAQVLLPSTTPATTITTTAPGPTLPPSPFDCTFEDGLCKWTQATDDNFDWMFGTGFTKTYNTGPLKDHTLGTAAGHYLYIETSNPRVPNDTARLVSPAFEYASPTCFSFWFHMYGEDVETLNVYLLDKNSNRKLIWTRSGTLNRKWYKRSLNVLAKLNSKLIIEATRGQGYKGDIAIDDIKLQKGHCPYIPSGCNFENGDLCDFAQAGSDNADWSLGPSSSSLHLPKIDHTRLSRSGHYMYVDGNHRVNDTAKILIPLTVNMFGHCVTFWYNMNGSIELNVYSVTSGYKKMLKHYQESTNSVWVLGNVQIKLSSPSEMMLEARINGKTPYTYVAIDDVKRSSSSCGLSGDCSFEYSSCYWQNDRHDNFDWVIKKAGVGQTGPKTDHTLQNSNGSYFFIEGSSPQKPGDKATLISPYISRFPIRRCLKFWYSMHGGQLEVKVRGRNMVWWRVFGSHEDSREWKYAQVPLLLLSFNRNIVITGTIGTGSKSYIALDDVTFQTISCNRFPKEADPRLTTPSTTIPPTTPTAVVTHSIYDCSFEHDYCSWTQSTDDDFNWVRAQGPTKSDSTGPDTDHTLGTASGWYVYIETSRPRKRGEEALLVSPSFKDSTEYCFTFYYYMFGRSIGEFDVILNPEHGSKMTLLARTKNHGQIWKKEAFQIPKQNRPFTISFRGVIGSGTYGDIAIDDIRVNEGECPESGPLNCTFETIHLCGYDTPDKNGATWKKHSLDIQNKLLPKRDHTLQSIDGTYMFLEPSSTGQAQLVSPVIKRSSDLCMSFYYQMFGKTSGYFAVYQQIGQAMGTPIWIDWNIRPTFWKLGQITLAANDNYKVIFEGKKGNNMSSIIIDDISTEPGVCPEPGNCDFEKNTCTWQNMDGSEMSWRRGSGNSPGENTGPTTDHTKQTDSGHYMFIEALFRNAHDSAWFRSMSLPPTTGRCMRFWYHMYGKDMGGLDIRFVDEKTQRETDIWYLQGNQGNKWSFAQVAFASADIYYMKIIGTVGIGRSSNIAFDDITFTQDYCETVPITAKTKYVFPRQSMTTAPPTWSPTSFDCDFEIGLCSWQQGNDDDFDWKLNFGSTPSIQTGPTVDHTLKTKKGHYIFIETSSPQRPNDKAHLESKSFIPSMTGCLQFWYFMYGPDVDTLTVYIKDKGNLSAVWTRTGTTDPVWHQALVPIHSNNNIQIVLEGRKGPHMLGDIAIDDIAFSFKGCGISTDMTCGFEERKICDFHQSKKDDFDWRWTTARNYVTRQKDHTFGISQGHYMLASGSHYNSGQTATLVSATYTSKISKCAEFWYYMDKENAGTLNVYAVINGTRFKLWSRSGQQGDVWSLAQMTVTTTGSFQIEIEAVTDMKVVDISIDDFGIFEGECPKAGNCDFEKGWCTWNNKRTDDFDWQIGTGHLRILGAPHQDHTTDLITGHFIFLQSGYELKAGSRAELISEVLDGTFHNCMTFWYYMSGAGTGTLNIYTVTAKSKRLEWTLTGATHFRYWAYARLPLHHKQQAFKILIEGIKGESSRINIAIDDIFLTDQNCRLNPRSAISRAITITTPMIPATTAKPTPVPTPYDCTFEKGMCLWKQDTNDNFDWIRSQGPTGSNVSGPIYDHTRGDNDGWYVYTDISTPRDPFDKGRLIGPLIKGSQDRCLNFWYHMYGSYMSTLSVILSVNGTKVTRWTKSGNQGDTWWEASFTLAAQPQTTYQVIFEGSRSVLTNGQIAIDDIRFTKNKCQSDNPTYCDFEMGFCGYTQMKTADFEWKRAQGKTPTFFTGPLADHTTGTRNGYYVYMDATAKSPNEKAQLISPQYNSTSVQCLHFYYHMFGAHINELNVYRVDGSHIGEIGYPVWSRKYNQGYKWFQGQATITPSENYHIVFEGKVGEDSEGDIAIDDIYQTPGACQPPGFCDFEKGLCTWTNSKADEFDWLRNKGYTDTSNTGPSADHTLGTPEGYYIYIETSNPQAPGDVARMQSEDFLPSNTSLCLRFWYQMYGKDVDTLNVLVRDSNERGEGYVWSQKGDKGSEWLYGQLNVDPIYTNKPFHLILEGVRGSGYDGDIAVDDVEVSHGECAIMPGYADPKTIALQRVTCNFEDQNFCEWQQDTRDDFDWIVHKGRVHLYNTGPKAAHGADYYIYTHSIKSTKGSKAILSTPTLGPTTGKGNCFTFYYHMYGMQVGVLNIYTMRNDKKTLRWTKSGNQGGNWHHGHFNIDSKFNYKIYIESVSSGGYYDIIALDDIAMDGNPCPPARICDFDLDICGWTPQPHFDTWVHATNPTPIKDHSTGTTTGGFLYTNSSVISKTPVVFRTMSPAYPPATRSCLKFWYSMQGSNPGTLSVYVKLPYTEMRIWQEQGNQGTLWWHAHVEVGRPKVSIVQPYKFIFESVHPSGPTSNGIIMIDDVEHLPGPCSSNGLCDFEQDFCGFTNVYGDSFDWIRGHGKTDSSMTGPQTDHTLKSPNGHYAFIEGSAVNKGETGLLTSWVHKKTTASCFQFWYNMYGSGMGALNVYLWSPDNVKRLWRKQGNQEQDWLHASITVTSNSSFAIVFEAVRGSTYASDIAIDDVIFLDGSCETQTTPSVELITQPPTPASMLRCDFERGFCGWKQDSTENADWVLKSGFSTSDGPKMDHTKDSKMGSYIMLNSSRLNINRTARLMSDIIYQEQPVCLIFWYHMNGGDPGTLNVYVKNSGENKDPIWTKYGDQGIAWRYSEIEIAKPEKTNKIYFEAVRGSGIGDVSLDDINLLLDNCPPREFCDFEEADICGYEQGDTDIFDWSWGSGRTSTYFTGPRNDHTYGSKYGHYMYISTMGRSRNDHAHLYSPVYPATSHERCLSFWYFMYGSHVSKLNVYLYQNNRFGDQIWSMQLDQGRHWHLATVSVTSETPFQIVFEGINGNGVNGDIAIDDVKLSKEACDPVAFCTFEEGICGWENLHDIGKANFDWQRVKASNTSKMLAPSKDHTIGDRSGFYMLANVIHRKERDTARLKSQTIPLLANSPTSYCFHFWYDVYGIDIGELKVDITYHADSPMTIWSQKGLKGSKWRHGMVGIDNPYSHFEVVLVAVTGTGSRGYLALDDLQLKAGRCPNTTESTFTCKSGEKISASKVCDFLQDCPDFDDEGNCGSCVFEDSTCTWQDSSIGQYNWTRVQGLSDPTSKKMTDHTTSMDTGWYVRVGKSGKQYRYDVGAVLQNRVLQKTSSTCQLKFWYYMAETYYSSLSLGILEGGRVTELWKKSHNHGHKWNMAIADIGKISRPFKLQFSVSSIYNRAVEIAIDDIELQDCNFPSPAERCASTEYQCKQMGCVDKSRLCDLSDDCGDGSDESGCENFTSCDFENSLCDWTQDTNDDFDWSRLNGATYTQESGPSRDHSKGTASGYYIYAEASPPRRKGDKTRLISPVLKPPKDEECWIRFFYHMNGFKMGGLNVYTRTSLLGTYNQVWKKYGHQGDIWEKADVKLTSQYNFQVLFEAEINGASSDIALDDITLTPGCHLANPKIRLPNGTKSIPTPSPCHSGLFQCKNSECLLQSQVCDFTKNCKDGSDEDICGNCDFEELNNCGWKDESTGRFVWQKHEGDSPGKFGPKKDHTTQSIAGKYLMVLGAKGVFETQTILETRPFGATSPTCQAEFYVFMMGVGAGQISLNVIDPVTKKVRKQVARVAGNQGGEWKRVVGTIGAQPAGFSLQFEALPNVRRLTFGTTTDMAIDDVSLFNCGPESASSTSQQPPLKITTGTTTQQRIVSTKKVQPISTSSLKPIITSTTTKNVPPAISTLSPSVSSKEVTSTVLKTSSADKIRSTPKGRKVCGNDSFSCPTANHLCFPFAFRCDGYADCPDNYDEENCVACPKGQTYCIPKRKCITSHRCDGNAECPDNSDETACKECTVDFCINGEMCTMENGLPECRCADVNANFRCVKIKTAEPLTAKRNQKVWVIPVGVVLALIITAILFTTIYLFWIRKTKSYTPETRIEGYTNPAYDYGTNIPTDFSMQELEPSFDDPSQTQFSPTSIENPLYGN